ncbi:Hypothetical predicted protein [Lecanosticta acicola]|uniref:Heterokaryon incompatibility domain-containing protein n=1 Tax=Lecanosticta acicola TaxID=111012 RepID=A0AAI9EEX5_9PEZI|nr:Hypothetical predicted protein [Lecanosticta acicola]
MADVYAPLARDTIRLLNLGPGSKDDPLCCDLIDATLGSGRPYETMSYLWASGSEREEMRVGAKGSLSITTSAANALRRLRFPDQVRTLWMDQVCINQSDLSERSQQVGIMHRVYSHAVRVLMYLGSDPDQMAPSAKGFIAELQSRWDRPARYRYSDEQTMREERLPAPDSIKWKAYKTLMGLQYFKRVWMLQEVMLSKAAVAFWGEAEMLWIHIARVAAFGQASPDLSPEFAVEEDCTMVHQMLASEDEEARRLKWRIGLLSYRQAADPRDKIFAVMNLVSDQERSGFQADYTMATVDVYKKAAEHIIFNLDRSLDVLQNAGITSHHPIFKGERWPSWVPRWGDTDYSFICGIEPGHFLPCNGMPLDASLDLDNPDNLCVKGVEVGRIQHLEPRFPAKELEVFDGLWELTRL